VSFRPQARAEIREARAWYNAQLRASGAPSSPSLTLPSRFSAYTHRCTRQSPMMVKYAVRFFIAFLTPSSTR